MSKPLQFQINGANRIFEILQHHRSVFLADEVGLGKTYTSTLLIRKMAEEKWKNSPKQPFYVLYVGPSKALVQKNCSDMVRKYRTTGANTHKLRYLNEYKGDEAVFDLVRKYIEGKKKIDSYQKEEIYKYFVERYKEFYPKIYEEKSNSQHARKATIIEAWNETYNKYNGILQASGVAKDLYGAADIANNLNGKFSVVPDRLLLLKGALNVGNGIQEVRLASSSIQLLGKQATRNRDEKALIRKSKPSDGELSDEERKELWEKEQIIFKQFDLVIFDEYHRYFESVDFSDKDKCRLPMLEEQEGPKYLFVSATPYKVGKEAGNENDDYEDETLKNLPTFESFSKLVYEDYTSLDCEKCKWPLCKANHAQLLCMANEEYTRAINEWLDIKEEDVSDDDSEFAKEAAKKAKEKLQSILQERMVRHERTLLSKNKYQEKQTDLFDMEKMENYSDQLRNMYQERSLLKRFGYRGNALRWGLSMPYLLSFSTSYGSGKDTTKQFFEDLKPRLVQQDGQPYTEDEKKQFEALFVGKDTNFTELPKKNLAFYHICENQIKDNQRLRIWLPATKPTHEVDEKSIYYQAKRESKLLVFAEATCMQRGGAFLVSQYADTLNKRDVEDWKNNDEESFNKAEEVIKTGFDFSSGGGANANGRTSETPYHCIRCLNEKYGLELDAEYIQEAFNIYFRREEVKNALLAWMYQRKDDFQPDFSDALEKYCYEGNLYAVLEEWLFCREHELDTEIIDNVLKKTDMQMIHPLSLDEYCESKENTMSYNLAFAERLTADIKDNGASGTSDENQSNSKKLKILDSFNSPFYPMVLFVGRGAQEGFDLHFYCNRMMHMTLPNGPVSFDQRQGRMDRFHSLLVRKRAVEIMNLLKKNQQMDTGDKSWQELFDYIIEIGQSVPDWKEDKIFPHWQIKEFSSSEDDDVALHGYKSEHHFERIVPVVKYTREYVDYMEVLRQLAGYRGTLGSSHVQIEDSFLIDLKAPEVS